MKIVGLTGGIGSGKTKVADMFSSFGVPVFNADESAKSQYKNPEVLHQLTVILNTDTILDINGELNKTELASIIFNDEKKRALVNELIHPLVKKDFDQWKKSFDIPYCIREAAILIESGSYKDCDKIIVVTADIHQRIERVMLRDKTSKEMVEKRIKAQMSDEERITYADFIIENNGDIKELYASVLKIHEELL